ncbi:MAG: glycosyltransferase family 9 protein, partial [Elusimicrobia bacterium]|nr:glycosyltransferase family 9 protein [Elusimicrobiota bacterium]
MKRILVIRLSSLGDIVLTTPVYRNLKEAWPTCQISVLVKERFSDVLIGDPSVDEVIPWRSRAEKSGGTWSQLQALRRRNFDLVIDLHGTPRSWLISLGVGASERVRYRKASWARRALVWWKRRPPVLTRHTVDRYLDVLRSLGLSPRRYPPDLIGRGPAGGGPVGSGTFTLAPVCPRLFPKRVLIVQTAFLGDAVLTTPLVRAVKEGFPSAVIIVSCTPETAAVFRGAHGVTALVIDDKRGRGTGRGPFDPFDRLRAGSAQGRQGAKGLLGFWQMVRRLRRLHCDVALLPHRSVRSALLVRLAGVPRRIGFETSPGRWWYTDRVPFLWGEHDIHRNLRLLEPLGVRAFRGLNRPSSPQVTVGPSAHATAGELLEQQGVRAEELLVGIAPGSLWATKRWLPERFAAVADSLVREFQARILLFGSAADRPVVQSVKRAMHYPCIDLAGQTSLGQLIALTARCRLFLSNDSGAMHVAVATGVPTIALFGPTTQELGFAPYGETHQVIERELPCRPCSLHGGPRCPEGHFQCMRGISTDEVLDAARAMLRQVLGACPSMAFMANRRL